MKKFFKFLCGAASLAAVGFGAYYVYKNVLTKDTDEDDDFDDCFEEDGGESAADSREYVSINITDEPAEETDSAETAETDSEETEEA